VKQPLEEIGRLAIETMLSQLAEPEKIITLSVKAELVLQESG
jgi:DNA-binding LacI/PurR family transcriptional regulator